MRIDYDISDIRPFINWIYFDYAWSMNGKDNEERDRLHADANAMLDRWQGSYHTHAVFRIVDANSDGDDIIISDVRLEPYGGSYLSVAGAHHDVQRTDYI